MWSVDARRRPHLWVGQTRDRDSRNLAPGSTQLAGCLPAASASRRRASCGSDSGSVAATVSTTVQPADVSAGPRTHLRQPGRDDTGVTQETVDGMSLRRIERSTDTMRGERYRFRPVRRVLIPKKNGKTRRLACRHGRTSSSAKWSGSCWRRTTTRRSPTTHTDIVPAGAATPRCGRWPTPGPARPWHYLVRRVDGKRILSRARQLKIDQLPGDPGWSRVREEARVGRGRLG